MRPHLSCQGGRPSWPFLNSGTSGIGLLPEQKAAARKHKVYIQKFTRRGHFGSRASPGPLPPGCEARRVPARTLSL